jgi:hypothetical protein
MTVLRWLSAAALALACTVVDTAQAAAADDAITITGCVARTAPTVPGERSLLVWSRGNVMLTAATARVDAGPVGTSGRESSRILYWIDDEDDLAKYAGQHVEIVGEVNDELEKGEIEIDRKDDYTEIEFEWDGKDVTARVPTWMIGDDDDFEVVVRRVDVETVRVVTGGTCR